VEGEVLISHQRTLHNREMGMPLGKTSQHALYFEDVSLSCQAPLTSTQTVSPGHTNKGLERQLEVLQRQLKIHLFKRAMQAPTLRKMLRPQQRQLADPALRRH
jgi:hypothetical protein